MHPTECTFTASGFRREEFDHFMSIARELGIKVDCAVSSSGKTATVHVSDMPDVQDAETMRTRRAGRPSKGVVLPHDSIFNNETTCAEYLPEPFGRRRDAATRLEAHNVFPQAQFDQEGG